MRASFSEGSVLTTAYIGLGSNRGDRLAHLRRAVSFLSERAGRVCSLSSVYETAPVGVTGQRRFLNAAAGVETDLGARGFFEELQRIEVLLGRVRAECWGPRSIDLDLLLFGSARLESSDLTVPHPRMLERRFVLEPLAEIAGGAAIPGAGGTVSGWLSSLPRSEWKESRVEPAFGSFALRS